METYIYILCTCLDYLVIIMNHCENKNSFNQLKLYLFVSIKNQLAVPFLSKKTSIQLQHPSFYIASVSIDIVFSSLSSVEKMFKHYVFND